MGSALINLTGLEGLMSIGGDLRLSDNNSLTSLTGLDNLTFINGNLELGYPTWYGPGGNPLLTSVEGLGSLTSIGGRLSISSNHALTSLTGMDNVTSIEGDLQISNNDALISLTGLDNLNSIGGELKINYNFDLTSLTGLDNLTSLTALSISNNNSLSSCEAQWLCDYLANPNGSVSIYSNAPGCNNPPEIANACGITLPCLPFGNYYFHTQSQIDNFATNYPDCTILEGHVLIMGESITNLNGLDNVTSIGGYNVTSIGGYLTIHGTDSLTNLIGLDNLTSIGGGLTIGSYSMYGGNNPVLTSLSGIDNLTSIGGPLSISSNHALTNLTGLDNVTSIGADLRIYENDSLISLTGLENIDATTIDELIIYDNSSLSTCEVQSICDYLSGQGDTIFINSNATGCNSQAEVEGACWTSVEEINTAENYSIYPNPVIDIATFSSEEITSFELYDLMGVLISNRKSNKVDVLNLNPGVYFVVGFDNYNQALYKGKIIKK